MLRVILGLMALVALTSCQTTSRPLPKISWEGNIQPIDQPLELTIGSFPKSDYLEVTTSPKGHERTAHGFMEVSVKGASNTLSVDIDYSIVGSSSKMSRIEGYRMKRNRLGHVSQATYRFLNEENIPTYHPRWGWIQAVSGQAFPDPIYQNSQTSAEYVRKGNRHKRVRTYIGTSIYQGREVVVAQDELFTNEVLFGQGYTLIDLQSGAQLLSERYYQTNRVGSEAWYKYRSTLDFRDWGS